MEVGEGEGISLKKSYHSSMTVRIIAFGIIEENISLKRWDLRKDLKNTWVFPKERRVLTVK